MSEHTLKGIGLALLVIAWFAFWVWFNLNASRGRFDRKE